MPSSLKRKKKQAPLVSHHNDLKLVQQVHKKKRPTLRQFFHIKRILSKGEKVMFYAAFVALVFGIGWGSVVLAQQYRIEVPDVGGQHIEGIVGSPQLINPLFASLNDVDADLARLVYSGLMRYDGRQRLVPDLAASYEISEDQLTYTFTLREGVVWHDEESFTARDVVYTIQTIQDPEVDSPLRFSLEGVEVSAPDDQTVVFTLQEPFQPFLSVLTVGILPEHEWGDVTPERMRLSQKNLQPIGTGPFQYSKFSKDAAGYILSYELVRFEEYYRQPPFLKTFIIQFFGDFEGPSGAIQALREKKVHSLNFVPSDLRDKVERKTITLHTLQLPEYTALFFNEDGSDFLQDDDMRTALAYALDKDRIVRESLKGEGETVDSPILPGFPGYDPEMARMPYDTDGANTLLDESFERMAASDYREERREAFLEEWKKNNPPEPPPAPEPVSEEGDTAPTDEDAAVPDESAAGAALASVAVSDESDAEEPVVVDSEPEAEQDISVEVREEIERMLDQELSEAQTFYRKNKAGDILQLDFVTSDTPEQKHAAQLIAGFWQEIGVKTNLRFIPAEDIGREVLKERSYDILLYGIIVGGDPDQYPFWHSSQIDAPGLNLSRYVNRKIDALLEEARESTDEEKQAELYTKFQEIILDDKPAIFLYAPTYTYAIDEELRGFDVTQISHPSHRFANVIQWYLKTDGRWQFTKKNTNKDE